MKDCSQCKNRDTSLCDNCEDGDYWESAKDTLELCLSAAMFGSGMGGIIAIFLSFFV